MLPNLRAFSEESLFKPAQKGKINSEMFLPDHET